MPLQICGRISDATESTDTACFGEWRLELSLMISAYRHKREIVIGLYISREPFVCICGYICVLNSSTTTVAGCVPKLKV